MQNLAGYVVAGIVVAVLFLLFFCTGTIQPGFRGVKVTLGAIDKDPLPEGFYTRAPGFTQVYNIPVKQITRNTRAECFSSDLQTVTVTMSVLYRIPGEMVVELFQKYAGDPYDTLVEPRIQETLKKEVSSYTAEEIIKKRDKIKADILPQIVRSVNNIVIITDIVLTNVDLRPELERAIEQKQIKQQEAQAAVYVLQKAEKDAETNVAIAKGEAEAIRLKAEAINKSPSVIYLEVIKKWDGKAPTYIGIGGGSGLNLPGPGAGASITQKE